MFEIKLAFKYLLPRKKSLSTSLISLMSIGVISLVVWLILLFLSITTGIESNWLNKLTSLNAPVRITPTNAYYTSYYYQIDSFSSSSGYSYKTIGEKAETPKTDPYQADIDMEKPLYLPRAHQRNDVLVDPVKDLYSTLQELKMEEQALSFQDYEMSGALMRLAKNRPTEIPGNDKASFLSQMSYLVSFSGNNPQMSSLLLEPNLDDIQNILFQMGKSHTEWQKDSPEWIFSSESDVITPELLSLFSYLEIKEVSLHSLPLKNLPPGSYPIEIRGSSLYYNPKSLGARIEVKPQQILLKTEKEHRVLSKSERLQFSEEEHFSASIDQESLLSASHLDDVKIHVDFNHQSIALPFTSIRLEKIQVHTHVENPAIEDPYWPYFYEGAWHLPKKAKPAVLLPKSYRDSGILIGDHGYLSFIAPTAGSTQEMRLGFIVAGFYDPGIMPTGVRCLFVPPSLTRTINSSSQAFSPDGTETNGVLVWTDSPLQAEDIKARLEKKLEEKEISQYWSVKTFRDYEFSQGLLRQFQSDRTLFMFIAIMIIIVACSNIISLLVILVNDKKREIAILSSMGASRKSIARIFGLCGVIMGLISSMIGTAAAIITLKNLHSIVAFLSRIQGYDIFQTAFFGESLPNDLSFGALKFVLIVTPVISLIAGLIPAIKASKMKPSEILRSE